MDKANLEKDKKLLVTVLRKLKSSKDLSLLIDDLLTEEEILDLSQRIKIAKLILEGKTYEEISEKVNTSTATVSKFGQIIEAQTELKSCRSELSAAWMQTTRRI